MHPLAPAACARIKRAVQGWLSTAASANQLQLQCTTKTTRRPPSARASVLARPFGAAPREPQIHISTASCAMPCTPLAQDLQRHAPAQRAAPNRRPRPVRTRAAPTGLTPRLHTAGVRGAGAPAWGVKGGAGRNMPVSSHPAWNRHMAYGIAQADIMPVSSHPDTRGGLFDWATATPLPNTRARARAPTPHHARARANPNSCVLMTPLMAYLQVPNATAEDASRPARTAGLCASSATEDEAPTDAAVVAAANGRAPLPPGDGPRDALRGAGARPAACHSPQCFPRWWGPQPLWTRPARLGRL